MKKEIISGSLYQKYRPEKFEDILGQSEAIKSLKNAVENKRISHAYLFSGGRGSGKTSVARIFANEIKVSPYDVYEIDAASNRGVDQIRELRSSVETLPIESDHKVYIIDEAHMLTKEAFNALLKTLEEPPKHVIFILATTEINKILDTIISRCQLLEFKKGNIEILSDLIRNITKKEKIKIDKESIHAIAVLGDGSFRDTLSHLQKAISIFGKDIKFSEIKKILMNSDTDLQMKFISAIEENDIKKLLNIYLKVLEKDLNIESFAESILEKIRIILLIKNSIEFEKFFTQNILNEEINQFKKMKGINSFHLKKILEIIDLLKKTEQKKAAFEILLYELIKN